MREKNITRIYKCNGKCFRCNLKTFVAIVTRLLRNLSFKLNLI